VSTLIHYNGDAASSTSIGNKAVPAPTARTDFMTDMLSAAGRLDVDQPAFHPTDKPLGLDDLKDALGVTEITGDGWFEHLPFATDDVSAGTENELQVAVAGSREQVDLVRTIEDSNYYKNMVKRVASGDAPRKSLASLDDYLLSSNQIWENSWVRMPLRTLNVYARSILDNDLLADKRCCNGPRRCDASRFFVQHQSETFLRVPVSYLLKLSLAQAIGSPDVPVLIRQTGRKMLNHFLNDNTSPETHSFFPVNGRQPEGLGAAVIMETLLRYLLTQFLVQFANREFELEAHGQRVVIYFAPHPPMRQKQLNDLISDAFYRELFMSPCLSGWAQGEAKHRYMILCHEVLSRSQLNALAKLKEADIITNNLVVLPRTSNICLANNGTHLSLGSRKLTQLVSDDTSRFGEVDEKYYGDLVIKISEHFLPLFVGTYSAAPYRLDFFDFHPERALGFLPHQLDYTHLRMIWRRWKRKAHIKFFGRCLTPFGPVWLDRAISKLLGLKGDLVHDFRLIDYLVALLSTDESPSLNGQLDNEMQLKSDLSEMGIFDSQMPLYLLLRLRQHKRMGFSGFEARHYSLFKGFDRDMRPAVDLQRLVTLLAYHYILTGMVTHADIPDNPTVESERRQFFFGAAIGIPTLYVRKQSKNRLMKRILTWCQNTRHSRRYNGYLRVPAIEYQRALIHILKNDAGYLIEMLGLGLKINDLALRINDFEGHSVAHRIVRQISGGGKGNVLRTSGRDFNQAAETYYRDTLRVDHMREAFALFRKAARELDSWDSWRKGDYNKALLWLLDGASSEEFLVSIRRDTLSGSLPGNISRKMICLMLLVVNHQQTKHVR
jgi:hypothetical protein